MNLFEIWLAAVARKNAAFNEYRFATTPERKAEALAAYNAARDAVDAAWAASRAAAKTA
jgi:hypothetical protein